MSSISRQSTSNMFRCNVCNKYLKTDQGLKSHVTRLHRNPDGLSQTHPKTRDQPNVSSLLNSHASEDQHLTGMPSLTDSVGEGFILEFSNLRTNNKIIHKIPKASRSAAAAALATTIDQCVTDNSIPTWKRLAKFASVCFSVPTSDSHKNQNNKVSLATVINRNVKTFVDNIENRGLQDNSSPSHTSPNPHKSVGGEPPVKLIESKIANGDVAGAVRLLCSESSLAPFDNPTFELLMEKHPQRESQLGSPMISSEKEYTSQNPPFPVTTESVRAAIASFPPGSAAGPDLLKPQHLKDLTGHSAGASGARLLVSLVNLCSLMLCGKVPEDFCTFLYGASLCALNKKDGGIRPIAVGNTFRRLTAKLGCSFAMPRLGDYFKPIQFGFGTKGGAEAVAHAARRFISFPHSRPMVFMKLDFKNAFNSVQRHVMLNQVNTHIPELGPFLSQCYGQTTHLAFGPHVIPSACGIQQGDPLGPALFCLAVQPLAASLTSEINMWYLDDSSLGGSVDSVLNDLKTITVKSKEIGLDLNLSKCELFCLNTPDPLRIELRGAFRAEAPGIRFPEDEDFTLLGAPLTDAALSKAVLEKSSDLERLTDRLKHLSAHYAFYILKNCLAIPKLVYILRCSPTWRVPDSLDNFDSTLLTTLERVTNICFSPQARNQSTLPIAEGGLGLRQVSALAMPAFLASAHSTSALLTTMLPPDVASTRDMVLEEACEKWSTSTGQPRPIPELRSKQPHWEKGVFELVKKDLQQHATTLLDKARLLGVASKESGAFLHAVPSPPLGTFLPDQVFRVAVSLRLGTQICQPHRCQCGAQVDETGLHGLSCKKNQGRASRHATANDLIRRGLVSAGYPVSLEPAFVSPDNNKRPDGITLSPWERGRSLAWDFTCVDSQAASYLSSSAGIPLYAAANAEAKKRDKYAYLEPNLIFSPIAVECLGSFGQDSLKILNSIGRRIQEATGEKRAKEFFLQRLSIAVQKGNAAAILGSIPREASLDDDVCML